MKKEHIVCLAAAFTLCCSLSIAAEEPQPPPFSQWLGPQEDDKYPDLSHLGIRSPVVGPVIIQKDHQKLSKYDISLVVIHGTHLNLEKSANSVVTFDGKSFQRTATYRTHDDAFYIAGKIKLKRDEGWRIYKLNVRVTNGPLKGAIVHLWDHNVPKSIRDPYVSLFEIPKQHHVTEGPLEFDIVAFFAK